MKIAVFSGSFNPLHIGHKAIIEHLTQEDGFDMVYLIVSPKNPLKFTISADSANARYEAALMAVSRHPELKVKVDNIELGMPSPHYTIKTLDALKKREPENDFILVVGADNLANFTQWRDYKRILADYGLAVFPRDNIDRNRSIQDLAKHLSSSELVNLENIQLVDAPLVNISSTQIREILENNEDASAVLM